MTTYIYALVDPETDETGYVGKSVNPDGRNLQHAKNAEAYSLFGPKSTSVKYGCVGAWIASLWALGRNPRMVILDECDDRYSIVVEKRWIEKLVAEGQPLTNYTHNR